MLLSCCSSISMLLLFLSVVDSAAIKGKNEEFLSFLNDAFNMKNSEASKVLTDRPDQSEVCLTSGAVDSSAEILSVTPDTNSREVSETANEKSEENSDSTDHTDDDTGSKKNSKPHETSGLSPDQDSAESHSAERTNENKHQNAGIEKQPIKTQDPVVEDRSSEEMDGRLDHETHQERKRIMDTTVDAVQASDVVNDSQSVTDQGQDCTEVSGNTEENTSYESRPRRICASGMRASVSTRKLNVGSTDRVDSEALDRDNSNETSDAGIPVLTL